MKKLANWFYYLTFALAAAALVACAVATQIDPQRSAAIEDEILYPFGDQCCFCETKPAVERGGLCQSCRNRFRNYVKKDYGE